MGGQPGRIFKGAVRKLVAPGFHHDMGTGHPLGVEPPVISGSEPEGQLIILIIVLPDINVITIAAYIMKGTAGNFYFFRTAFSSDLPALDQFLLDLHQILFLLGNIKRIAHRFQMVDFRFCLQRQL